MSEHDPFAPLDGNQAGEDAPKSGKKAQGAAENSAPAPAEAEVPKGTRAEVLKWVGDDKEKAQKALDAEHATGEPRKTLVADLEEIVQK